MSNDEQIRDALEEVVEWARNVFAPDDMPIELAEAAALYDEQGV